MTRTTNLSHRSRARRRGAVAGAVLALLAAGPAAAASVISYAEINSPYSRTEVSYAADGRDFAVVVKGNPFSAGAVADDEAARAVVAAMKDQPGWFVTRYTLTPGESARPLYKVVWLFGVPAKTSIYGACRKDAKAATGEGEAAIAVFCRGEKVLSYIAGRMDPVASPTDPAFRRFVGDATRSLFPRIDSDRDGQPDNLMVP